MKKHLHTLSRREFLKATGTGSLALWLAACSRAGIPVTGTEMAPEATATLEAAGGTGTAIMAFGAEAELWDPGTASRATASQVFTSIYDPLFVFRGSTLQNHLVDNYSFSEDGTLLTLNLRQGVRFHDGSEVQASDAVYSMIRMIELEGPFSLLWKDIVTPEQIQTTGDYSFTLSLDRPYGAILDTLAWVYVLNEDLVREHYEGDDYGQTWVNSNDAGSGPFTISEFQPGERLAMTRFSDYFLGWGPRYLDGYVIEVIREPATIRLAMQNGQAHVVSLWSIDVDSHETIRDSGATEMFEFSSPTVVGIKMNTQKAPTDNKDFRKAMGYAFDYEGVIQGLLKGRSDYVSGAYPQGFKYWKSFENSEMLYRRDLDRARFHLEESGYQPGGEPLVYNYRSFDPTQRDYGLILQSSLKEIGVDIELEGVTGPEFAERQRTPENAVNFNRISGRALMVDPDFYLMENAYSESWYPDRGYWATMCFYRNDEVDRLIEEARFSIDEADRQQKYERIQDVMYDDAPEIWVDQQRFIVSVNNSLKGFEPQPFGGKDTNMHPMYFEDA